MRRKSVFFLITALVLILCVGLVLFLTLTAPKRVVSDGLLTDSRIRSKEVSEDGTAYTLTLSNGTCRNVTLGTPTFQYKERDQWTDTGAAVSGPADIRLSALSSIELQISVKAEDSTGENDGVLSVSSLRNFSPTGEYRLLFPAKDSSGDTFSVPATLTPVENRGFVCGVIEERDGMPQNDFVTLKVDRTGAGQYLCTLKNATGSGVCVDYAFLTLQRKTEDGWERFNPYPEGTVLYDTTYFLNPQGTRSHTIPIPDAPGEYRIIAEYTLGEQTCFAVAIVTEE